MIACQGSFCLWVHKDTPPGEVRLGRLAADCLQAAGALLQPRLAVLFFATVLLNLRACVFAKGILVEHALLDAGGLAFSAHATLVECFFVVPLAPCLSRRCLDGRRVNGAPRARR